MQKIAETETTKLDESLNKLDLLYMTRVQQERFADKEEYERLKDTYILDKEKMEHANKKMLVMHPLPRVNEISNDIDSDKRAVYFKQATYGMYVRMALIMKLLDRKSTRLNSSHLKLSRMPSSA